ncbi:MAG: class I SAM-dependent methyltransferase [Gaiellaceae bacterium]
MDHGDYRQASLATWEAMARGWERWRAEFETTNAPVREWMLNALSSEPGDTVLELAAGPGDTGFRAAAIVGEGGRLISTDFSPEMVEVAKRRSAELGLGNVEHRVMDAERMGLEDDSVDGVLCRFGFMLMSSPAGALSETRRVLRTSGRLVLAVWCCAERNPWISIVGRLLVEGGHVPAPEPGAPGMFTMANEERTRRLLKGAGFSDVHMEEVPLRFTYRDLDEYVRRARDTGGVFSRVFAEADDDERAALEAELESRFAPFAVAGGYEFPGVALAVAAN